MTVLRQVGATLDMSVNAPADLILSMAVAADHDYPFSGSAIELTTHRLHRRPDRSRPHAVERSP